MGWRWWLYWVRHMSLYIDKKYMVKVVRCVVFIVDVKFLLRRRNRLNRCFKKIYTKKNMYICVTVQHC